MSLIGVKFIQDVFLDTLSQAVGGMVCFRFVILSLFLEILTRLLVPELQLHCQVDKSLSSYRKASICRTGIEHISNP
jgi:hypothetical protein